MLHVSRDNWENVAHEMTLNFVGEGAHPNGAAGGCQKIVIGNLEGAVLRGRGGKEKKWTDCVQSDIRAFGVARDWKATALEAEVWVETVMESRRSFMAAWRKEGGRRG